MLSSGLRKVMKALLILLAAAWITTGANATSEGERAPGLADKRFVSTYLYAAVRPATDDAFALVLPEVNANTMDVFLDRFAACLAQNTHAIVLLDQAGWHGEKALAVPVGGAIHSIKSVRIPLPHELSGTHGGSRRIAP
jgi:DDE superfamily endonuclease